MARGPLGEGYGLEPFSVDRRFPAVSADIRVGEMSGEEDVSGFLPS